MGLFSGECASFHASYDFSNFSLDQCHWWTRAPVPCRRHELPRKAKLSMAYKYESEDNQGIVLTYFLKYYPCLNTLHLSLISQNQYIRWGNYIFEYFEILWPQKSCLFVFHSHSLTRTCFPGMFWNSKKLVF